MISTNGYTYRLYGMFHWSFYEMFTYLGAEKPAVLFSAHDLCVTAFFESFFPSVTLHWLWVCFSAGNCNSFLNIHWWTSQNIHLKVKLGLTRKVKMEKKINYFTPRLFFFGQGNTSDHVSTPFGRVYFINYHQTFKQRSQNSLNNAKC